MTPSRLAVAPFVVALSIAVPAWAAAQAAGARTPPSGSTSSGAATPRGSSSSNAGSPAAGSGGSASTSGSRASGASAASSSDPAGSRDRNGRPIVGTASPRANAAGGSVVVRNPWLLPTYIGNLGAYGYYGYNPLYGYSWPWYDYDPYGSMYGAYDNPYAYGGGYPPGGYGSYGPLTTLPSGPPSHPTGAIRLKVSPDTAEVYVDGTPVGAAGDFDGLVSHHLVLEAGSHTLEIRAGGYASVTKTITVEAGKTMTERLSLKKTVQ